MERFLKSSSEAAIPGSSPLPAGVSGNAKKGGQLPSVQAMRALAALLVVLFHVTEVAWNKLGFHFLNGFFNWGIAGVDMFFVLSGFIICHVHRRDFGQPGQWRVYLTKRLIRVYPLYWLLLGAAVAVAFLLPQGSGEKDRNAAYIVASFFLFPQPDLPVLGVAWTLSHELFFYLMFSVLILGKGWASRAVIAGWLVLSVVVCFLHPLAVSRPGGDPLVPFWISFVFSYFNLEFALGAAVALFLALPGTSALLSTGRRLLGWILLGAVIAGAGICWLNSSQPPLPMPLWRALLVGGGAALALLGAVCYDRQFAPGWLNRGLQPIGDASYAIYLLHYPLLVVLFTVAARFGPDFGVSPTVICLVALVVAVAAGWLLHFLIERPLLRGARAWLLPKSSA